MRIAGDPTSVASAALTRVRRLAGRVMRTPAFGIVALVPLVLAGAVGEVATRDYLRRELEELRDLINDMRPPDLGAGKDKSGKSEGAEKRSKRLS